MIRALVDSFPDIQFNTNSFGFIASTFDLNLFLFCVLCCVRRWVNILAGNHWANVANQKKFLDFFAATHRFDPLHASKWYSVQANTIRKFKVCDTVEILVELVCVGK